MLFGSMADERARRLRKTMTPQEVKLWVHLRALREQGYHFRKQAPLKGHIVDFVCFRYRSIVEADGHHHGFDKHRERDAIRDARLAGDSFRILRFSNHDIDRSLNAVIDTIFHALTQRARTG
jgi:very-short-patch-repair endonuclease